MGVVMERDENGRFAKGHLAWNEGKRLPEVSLRLKKLWKSPEYRERQIEAHIHPNPEHSVAMKKVWEDPEYRERQRIAHLGNVLSSETREKISRSLQRIKIPEEELRRLYLDERLSTIKIAEICGASQGTVIKRLKSYGIKLRTRSEALKGKTVPEEVRKKISESKQGQRSSPSTEFKKGFEAPKKWRVLWSKIMKEKWKDPQYVEKVMMARHSHPNIPETELIQLIEENQLPFYYSGDGKVTIGGLCPDFIHSNGEKKIIEVFGRVFHDPKATFKDDIPWKQQYWGRMAYFSQLGYNCLILWDDELDNEIEVVEKIRRLNNV